MGKLAQTNVSPMLGLYSCGKVPMDVTACPAPLRMEGTY